MLEWMIALVAVLGAVAGFGLLYLGFGVLYLELGAVQVRGRAKRRRGPRRRARDTYVFPRARIHRWHTSPR